MTPEQQEVHQRLMNELIPAGAIVMAMPQAYVPGGQMYVVTIQLGTFATHRLLMPSGALI